MEVKRRTQLERSEATRNALVAAARRLFAEHGYANVGTEAIVKAAGVTRGAMYHQFPDKAELFAAVFEAVETDLMGRMAGGIDSTLTEPRAVLEAGVVSWLDACAVPEVQQIVLLDGPVVLGYERWREIGMRFGAGLMETLLQEGMDDGWLISQPVRPLAHVLIGALDEAALFVAQADDPNRARAEVSVSLGLLVEGLLVQ
jgi:AcrR family transcriptional regulator